MENLINIKCAGTTYLCNSRPNSNFHKEKNLLIGVINNNFKDYNLFKSLLKFNISNINLSEIRNVYLYLYFESLYNPTNNKTISLSLSVNNEDTDITTVNWLTCPKKINGTKININLTTYSAKKYIRIDISHIFKFIISSSDIYNILLEPLNVNSSSLLQFSSNNTNSQPYLIFIKNNIDIQNSSTNFDAVNSENNNNSKNEELLDNEEFDIEDFSAEIITELNNQNSRFDTLDENLSYLINSFNNIITTLKSASANLNNKLDNGLIPPISKLTENISDINNSTSSLKDYIETIVSQGISADSSNNIISSLNELIKTEIYQVRNSMNNNILELQSYIADNLSTLNLSIKTMNEGILELSTQISKICETVEDIITTPIDNKSI